MQDSNSKLIYFIVAVFTLLQFIVLLLFGYTPYPDSNGYISIAKECIAQGQPYPSAAQIDNGGFLWNVGSINIVALFLSLFHSITPLLCLYAVLKGVSALLVYNISNKLFGAGTAFLTLIIYVLYPANYGESTSVLSELPFMFFVLLGVWMALKGKVLAGGMSVAIANWMRPMGIVFVAAMVVYFLAVKRYKDILRTVAGYVTVIAIIGSMSYARTGYFIYQAKTGWMALLQYSVDNSPEDDAYYTDADGYNIIQKDSVWQKRMLQWVVSHPKDYVLQMPKKLVKTYVSDNVNLCVFLPDKSRSNYMYGPLSMEKLADDFPHYSFVQWLTVYNLIYYYCIMVLFVLGCVVMIRRKELQKIAVPAGVVFFGTLVLLLVCHGESRFHIPFMPFIIMVAAYWIQRNACFIR